MCVSVGVWGFMFYGMSWILFSGWFARVSNGLLRKCWDVDCPAGGGMEKGSKDVKVKKKDEILFLLWIFPFKLKNESVFLLLFILKMLTFLNGWKIHFPNKVFPLNTKIFINFIKGMFFFNVSCWRWNSWCCWRALTLITNWFVTHTFF